MPQHSLVLTGNIVRNPEIRPVNGEHKVMKFRIACSRARLNESNESWKNYDQLFVDVDAWDVLAENAYMSIRQGQSVIVVGVMTTQEWKDTNDKLQQRNVVKASHIGLDLNKYIVKGIDSRTMHDMTGVLEAKQDAPIDDEAAENAQVEETQDGEQNSEAENQDATLVGSQRSDGVPF